MDWSFSGHQPFGERRYGRGVPKANQIQRLYRCRCVFLYTSWLETALNSAYIHRLTNWVAQYNGCLTYGDLTSNYRGWQYTEKGNVSGVGGKVDLNAFGYATWPASDHDGVSPVSIGTRVTNLAEGDYCIASALGNLYMDIYNSSSCNGVAAIVWPASGASNQLFHISPVSDGHYTISNVSSGKGSMLSTAESRTERKSFNGKRIPALISYGIYIAPPTGRMLYPALAPVPIIR